ncbi:peptidoglycan amidohydrolase family protein [Pseudolactococcus reticulitermitis]|uniref:Bacteriophage lysin domain-containing protein n=1 Tax=Pseudolactococcus reticulitermitis TaxID=2025039 RepID=A0A224X3M6_9LACT|nr:peptidoglycan amidohydrolase family protein [Lactococcus reticulitermitis]GAX47326.1 hypothetical protein RsY01_925 [Lactococcus reticulitermitis]
MTANNNLAVSWFDNRKGKLTYSMYGSRNGTDGTADCSGSTTQAIKDSGGSQYAYLYSTVTLASYLSQNGYTRISANESWDAQRGDVVLMSWGPSMAYSSGAGGHVGLMKDASVFISVDYWTGGQAGTAVSEHDWNYYYSVQKPMYIEVWRVKSMTPAPPKPQPATYIGTSAHVQGVGWKNYTQTIGTTGKSLRLEAFVVPAGVEGEGHVEKLGWTGRRKSGEIIGTAGSSKRLEAIKLYGNIKYRVHVQGIGWTGWVESGQQAGTTGQSKRIEAIEIVKK